MPIWLMVLIDRWLGGFLVLMLAPFAARRVASPIPHHTGFGPNPPADQGGGDGGAREWQPGIIVVSKYFGMGSIVLAVPLLRQLRLQFPSARMLFLSFSTNRKLLAFLPYVDEVMCLRTSPHLFVWDTLKTLWMLHRRRVEVFLNLESYSRYSALFSFCSGAGTRVGFHTASLPSRGQLFSHRVYWSPYRHAMENFLALGGAIGVPPGPRMLELRALKPAEEKKGRVWLRKKGLTPARYILFTPNSDSVKALNTYPRQRWLELADLLYRRSGCHVVVVGAKADPRWTLAVAEARSYVHNLSGKTSFTALMVILKDAACLVSVDTGIAHLAAVLQIPTVTLFGPDAPVLYGPVNPRGRVMYANLHCSPCVNLLEGKRSDCRNNVCINRWAPEAICEEVLATLKGAGAR